MNGPISTTGPNAVPDVDSGIDMDVLFEKLDFEPHSPAQWEYCRSPFRFNIPCCGRRWGKTLSTGHRLTHKMFKPESYNWCVGPTYRLGEKEFRITYNDFRKLGLLKYCKASYSVKQGDMRIQTPWNAILEVVSAEKPDALLGEGLSHAVMCEAAKHQRMIWEQFVEPALSDLLGTCDFPSTPQGYNWYHGLWLMGQAGSEDLVNYKSYHFPSWTNPVRYPGGLSNAEIVRIRATVSKHYFDQEYGADFTTFSGAIYDEWNELIHVKEHKFNPHWPNFLAFDYGFANPFVCLDIQVDPSDTMYIWREYHSRYMSTYENGQYLLTRDNPENYNISGMWGDPRGANEAATLALMLGWVASEDVPWKLGIEEVKRRMKPDSSGFPKFFVDPSCTNTRRSLGQLHIKEASRMQKLDLSEFTGDGNIQHKVDDHEADAVRYFVGPYFVNGAGTHLDDSDGNPYRGSESEDFFRLHTGITLEDGVVL